MLKAEEPEQAIVFCRTKIGTARLDRTLRDRGLQSKALHGDMSQGQRDGVMISFKEHKSPLLVATDVAARGLDIEHVTHVINFDLPNNSEIYVHRIGRTGRVGRTGPGDHLRDPEGAWRDRADRARREDVDRRVGAARGADRPRAAPEAPPRAQARPGHGCGVRPGRVGPGRERVRRQRAAAEPAPEAPVEAAEPIADVTAVGIEADDGRPSAEVADRPEIVETNGHVKLFINRGSRSGIEEEDIRWALSEGAVIPADSIHDVRVLERFTFVDLDGDQAEKALDRLDGTKLKGKQIRLEYANG